MKEQFEMFGMDVVAPTLSREASIEAMREGIDRGELGLQTARSADAIAAARRVASRGREFTTDEIWLELGWKPVGHDEASFMGSVMRYLSQEKEIEKTGGVRKSVRPEQHRKELTIWRAVPQSTLPGATG
jgi:hypothetical protein